MTVRMRPPNGISEWEASGLLRDAILRGAQGYFTIDDPDRDLEVSMPASSA